MLCECPLVGEQATHEEGADERERARGLEKITGVAGP